MNTNFKRWTVQYESELETDTVYRKSFDENAYEDAVILAKRTGANCIYDNIELVWIEL